MEKDNEQMVMGVCMRCGTTTTDIEGGGLFPGLLVCPDCKAQERAANIAAVNAGAMR